MTELLELVGGVLLGAGAVVVVFGGVLILRMPTFYSRVHAASVNETLAPLLILLGLACFADGRFDVLVRLGLILMFLLLTSPMSSHALAKAAYRGGLPTGQYREQQRREREGRGHSEPSEEPDA
ncbi:MAG: monovalent cation/H(+) antiporter subunit G [Acidobacteriota bacterium]